MPELSLTEELTIFLEKYPLDGFIDKFSNSELSADDMANIDNTIMEIKKQESKLRALRQKIEYQVRKHKLQEFRNHT